MASGGLRAIAARSPRGVSFAEYDAHDVFLHRVCAQDFLSGMQVDYTLTVTDRHRK